LCSLWIVRWVGESRLQSDTIIVDISKVFRYGGSRAKLTGAWDEEGDFPKNEGCWHIATTKKIFYCTTATTSTTAAVDECTIILYTSADIATPHTVSVLCNTRKPTHPHTYAHTRILVDACVFDVWVTRQPWNHNHVRTHDVPRREQAGIPYPHCHHYPQRQPTVPLRIYSASISRLFVRLVFRKGKNSLMCLLFTVCPPVGLAVTVLQNIYISCATHVYRDEVAAQWRPRWISFHLLD